LGAQNAIFKGNIDLQSNGLDLRLFSRVSFIYISFIFPSIFYLYIFYCIYYARFLISDFFVLILPLMAIAIMAKYINKILSAQLGEATLKAPYWVRFNERIRCSFVKRTNLIAINARIRMSSVRKEGS